MSFLIVGRWRANGLPRTLMLLSLRIDEKFYDTRSWQIHLLWNHVNDRLGWLGTKASDSRQRCKLQVVELPFLIEILMGTMGIKRTCTVQWTTCCHAAFYDLLLFSSSIHLWVWVPHETPFVCHVVSKDFKITVVAVKILILQGQQSKCALLL